MSFIPKPYYTDAEILSEWRAVIRLRMEWSTMIYGSYKSCSSLELVSEKQVHDPIYLHGPQQRTQGRPVVGY